VRLTLTWDQGAEMVSPADRTAAARRGVTIPGRPWQRGTNGLLRRYFPKRIDLSQHTPPTSAPSNNAATAGPARFLTGVPPDVFNTALAP
jgi:IS30 family transposase